MFEKAKARLMQKDENGNCVFDHLVNVIEKVLQKQSDGFDDLEHISATIKSQKSTERTLRFDEAEVKEMESHIQSLLEVSGKPAAAAPVANEDEAPVEIDPAKIPDVMGLTQMFQCAGVDFEDDWWQLQCSCTRLVQQYPTVTETRFFGKIFGIENDYYIIEAKLESHEQGEEIEYPEKMEKPGVGVNEYVFFACNNLATSTWIQLPFVTPAEINTSRECRVMLRGVPNAPVGGRVSYPGNEASYLRCLIAQISSDTLLAPAGFFSANQESENPIEINKSEEFNMPEDMGALSNWVHGRAHLRREGRLTKFVKPESDEDENGEEEIPDEDAEEEMKILHGADADANRAFPQGEEEEGHPIWAIRGYSTIKRPYQVLEIRNKRWPGAITVFESSSNTFANVYVGDGVPFLNAEYVPQTVGPIMPEFKEFEDIADPENPEELRQSDVSMFVEEDDVLPPVPPEPVAAEENADDAPPQED